MLYAIIILYIIVITNRNCHCLLKLVSYIYIGLGKIHGHTAISFLAIYSTKSICIRTAATGKCNGIFRATLHEK